MYHTYTYKHVIHIQVFRALKITTIIRLNEALYSRDVCVAAGFEHHDLLFPGMYKTTVYLKSPIFCQNRPHILSNGKHVATYVSPLASSITTFFFPVCQKNLTSVKRAIYPVTTTLYSVKRNLYSVKRTLYSILLNGRYVTTNVSPLDSSVTTLFFLVYQKNPTICQKSPILCPKRPIFCQTVKISRRICRHWIRVLRPSFPRYAKNPTICQKSPMFCQNPPIFCQKSPIYCQTACTSRRMCSCWFRASRTSFSQYVKTPTVCQKSVIFVKKALCSVKRALYSVEKILYGCWRIYFLRSGSGICTGT